MRDRRARAQDVAVIGAATVGVGEDGVGFGDLLELGGVVFGVGVQVWVVLFGEDVEAFFEVGGGDGRGDAKDCVVGGLVGRLGERVG